VSGLSAVAPLNTQLVIKSAVVNIIPVAASTNHSVACFFPLELKGSLIRFTEFGPDDLAYRANGLSVRALSDRLFMAVIVAYFANRLLHDTQTIARVSVTHLKYFPHRERASDQSC
jgi:hypothetical protein